MATNIPIEDYFSGDTLRLNISVVDDNDNAVDIRSADIEYMIAQPPNAQQSKVIEVQKSVGSGITITDGANGKFEIDIEPTDTESLEGRFEHECEVTDTDGDVTTIFTGVFNISEDLIE